MTDSVRLGDTGPVVKRLQKALVEKGHKLLIDGDFGKGTQKALVAFQKSIGLLADGVAGKRTRRSLGLLKGIGVQPYHLTDNDVRTVARMLKAPIAAIRAVSEVESSGGGFIKESLPKILFERHWMCRMLKKNKLTKVRTEMQLKHPMLCSTKTGGYRGGLHEWTRFEKASTFHADSAICSTSWGRYQLMGFHYKDLGFKSAEAFKTAMTISEGEHIKAFAKFIRNDARLHQALKDQDWKTFARIYNGKGYAKNKYDTKLAEAYERYSSM